MDTVNKIKWSLVGLVFACTVGATTLSTMPYNTKIEIADSDSVASLDSVTCLQDCHVAKSLLIDEVDRYLKKTSPKTKLRGKDIVDACFEYGVDIKFVLAQAQIESNFGVAGVARKTNSPWNVKAYDGRSAGDMIRKGHGYDDPNKAIRPYLELITTKYMVNGKDEFDMMKKYVTPRGARYASSRTYESALSRTYQKIKRSTNIDMLYQGWMTAMEVSPSSTINDTLIA